MIVLYLMYLAKILYIFNIKANTIALLLLISDGL